MGLSLVTLRSELPATFFPKTRQSLILFENFYKSSNPPLNGIFTSITEIRVTGDLFPQNTSKSSKHGSELPATFSPKTRQSRLFLKIFASPESAAEWNLFLKIFTSPVTRHWMGFVWCVSKWLQNWNLPESTKFHICSNFLTWKFFQFFHQVFLAFLPNFICSTVKHTLKLFRGKISAQFLSAASPSQAGKRALATQAESLSLWPSAHVLPFLQRRQRDSD